MISQNRFERILDVPVSCPQVELRARSSLLVCTVRLKLGQVLRVNWLGAKIARLITTDVPLKVSSNLGLCYVGVYSGDLDDVTRPTGVSLIQLALNQVTPKQMIPHHFRNFTSPDTYSVFVTNNTSNLIFEVVVTGSAKLYLE